MKFEIESEQQQLIDNGGLRKKLKWTTCQLFLILSIGIVAASLLSNLDRIITYISNNIDNNEALNKNYDIVIVGGGTTGLFQLYFLSLSYPDLKIILLEKLNRIGGRSFSSHILYQKNNTHNLTINFDHGAMRCNYNHKYMMQTLYHFDLCDELVGVSGGDRDNTNSTDTEWHPFYYFRGHFRQWSDVNASYWDKVYDLQLNEFLQNVTEYNPTIDIVNYLLDYAWNIILVENGAEFEPQTDSEWNIFFSSWTFEGILIKDYDMLTFFRMGMNVSVEFLNHVEDLHHIFYYHARNMGWYYYAQFSQTRDFNGMFTLKHGFDTIANVIYNQILNDNNRFRNVEIVLNTSVIAIDKSNGNGKYKYEVNSDSMNIYSEKVILSIDNENMERMLPYIQLFDKMKDEMEKDKLFYSINNAPAATKINLIYNLDDSNHVDYLLSISSSQTDLELAKIYIEKAWSNDTLITVCIYAWAQKANYWYKLQIISNSKPFEIDEKIKMIDFNGNINDDLLNNIMIANELVVEEVTKQLNDLITNDKNNVYNMSFGLPIAAFIAPWGQKLNDWNSEFVWNTGVDIGYVFNRSMHPIENEDIYWVISPPASWQEKAYQAAIDNLQYNFHINDPFISKPQCIPNL